MILIKTGERCEYCGTELEAEFVDIGIGFSQVTKGECPFNCGYLEWEYKKYSKETESPLSFDEWLKQHEVK